MTKKIFFAAVLSLVACSGVSNAADYGKASKIESARRGNIVVRYVKEYESPCLLVQILDPSKEWVLISQKNFCSFGSKSLLTDVSYAAFEKISFADDGIHTDLNMTPLELSEDEVHACIVPIKGSVIQELKCEGPLKK